MECQNIPVCKLHRNISVQPTTAHCLKWTTLKNKSGHMVLLNCLEVAQLKVPKSSVAKSQSINFRENMKSWMLFWLTKSPFPIWDFISNSSLFLPACKSSYFNVQSTVSTVQPVPGQRSKLQDPLQWEIQMILRLLMEMLQLLRVKIESEFGGIVVLASSSYPYFRFNRKEITCRESIEKLPLSILYCDIWRTLW